jgi:hypothetical protein
VGAGVKARAKVQAGGLSLLLLLLPTVHFIIIFTFIVVSLSRCRRRAFPLFAAALSREYVNLDKVKGYKFCILFTKKT